MRVRIRLDTLSDIQSFIKIVSTIHDEVLLEDGNTLRVSAKSLLGNLYAMEFSEIYCYCSKDISTMIRQWMM